LQILAIVISIRNRIVAETDSHDNGLDEDEDMVEDDKLRQEASKLNRPSAEAIGKFEDYR